MGGISLKTSYCTKNWVLSTTVWENPSNVTFQPMPKIWLTKPLE